MNNYRVISKDTKTKFAEGIWYKCLACGEETFIPSGCNDYSYCPYCGEIITSYDGVGVCMDDCVIGTELNKVI